MPTPDVPRVRSDLNYDAVAPSFRWEHLYSELDWLPGGWLNMAHEAIDRHATGSRADKTALVWQGTHGEREDYNFGQMKEQSDRFANVLRSLGVEKGDRVFILLQRIPELYFAFFGVLKTGAIVSPMFSALGPEQVRDRLLEDGVKVLVTQPDLREKISSVVYELPELQHIIVVNKNQRDPRLTDPTDLDYYEEMDKAPSGFDITQTCQNDYSVINYTSGAAGTPKGVVHRHLALVQQHATAEWVLDLHDDDIYWCTADPGWAMGTSYAILAPWARGVTQVVYEGGFRASAWYEVVQNHGITVWYTTPGSHSDAHERRRRSSQTVRSHQPAPPHLHRRTARTRRRGMERRQPRRPPPGRLVADRDRRHTNRKLSRRRCASRVDGQAAARRPRGDRGRRLQRDRSRRGRQPSHPAWLALHVPGLLERFGAL